MNKALAQCVLASLSITFLPTHLHAESRDFPSLGSTQVYITNTSASTMLNFQRKGSSCTATNVSLNPDHYGTYRCDDATGFDFQITTRLADGSKVTRTSMLVPTKRYEVYSETSGVWNIREIASR